MDSAATNPRGPVAVVEGSQPAVVANDPRLPESADSTANVVKRLWRIEQELEAVEKSQTATVKMEGGGQYTYKYSGHDLILAFVRPLLAKHGVKTWPTTIKHERTGNLTMLTVRIDFINVDDPSDLISAEIVNYGADKGDKGGTKGLTNAVREGIKKALNITSEEDKVADEHTDFESEDGVSTKALAAEKETSRAAIEQWAKTFKSAIESAQDEKAIGRLQADNADQLNSEHLPAVTRMFFFELIAKRKTDVKPKAAT